MLTTLLFLTSLFLVLPEGMEAVIALSILSVVLVPVVAGWELANLEAAERFNITQRGLMRAAAIGVGCALPVVVLRGWSATPLDGFAAGLFVMLCSLLALGASIDRMSAFAPDTIVVSTTIAAVLVGIGPQSAFGVILCLIIAAAIVFASIGLWNLQERFDRPILPPADTIAMVLPMVLFGFDLMVSAAYLAIAVILLAIRHNETVARRFSVPEAVADALGETGLGDGPAVTLLSIVYPVILATLLLSEIAVLFS